MPGIIQGTSPSDPCVPISVYTAPRYSYSHAWALVYLKYQSSGCVFCFMCVYWWHDWCIISRFLVFQLSWLPSIWCRWISSPGRNFIPHLAQVWFCFFRSLAEVPSYSLDSLWLQSGKALMLPSARLSSSLRIIFVKFYTSPKNRTWYFRVIRLKP